MFFTRHNKWYKETQCNYSYIHVLSFVTRIRYYRVLKRRHHKKLFLHFSVLDTMYRWSMMKNIHSPNLVGIGSWWSEIWLHEYLISPIEISVNLPAWFQTVMNQANLHWFLLGLKWYSCSHISGYHEPIHIKFDVRGFFIIEWKCLNAQQNLMTSHFSTL